MIVQISLQKFWAIRCGRENEVIWQYVREGCLPIFFASVAQVGLQKFWATCIGRGDADTETKREGCSGSVFSLVRRKSISSHSTAHHKLGLCLGKKALRVTNVFARGITHSKRASREKFGARRDPRNGRRVAERISH